MIGSFKLPTVYLAFIKNAFLRMLAYRLRYYTGIITYLLFVSVHYFIWSAVFANGGGDREVNGFTLSQMITYISVGWITRSLYYTNIDYQINEQVRTGEIGVYLIRPVSFHISMIVQGIGEALFRLLFFTGPISIVIVLLFPVALPVSVFHAFCFVIALIFSFFILAEINFLVGLCAFSFKSINGLIRAKYFLVQLMSGLLLPLAFFPGVLKTILEYLPFQAMAHAPLQIYLGKWGADEILSSFLLSSFWLIALTALSVFMWRRAVDRLTIQGG